MKIYKAEAADAVVSDVEAELSLINEFAKTELTAQQVYTFSVALCDNEVDRDFERFAESTLSELAELFVGKTGIFDHEWRAANQTARVYRTEVVKPEGKRSSLGEQYCVLKGYAYMLRSEKNAELIEEIEAGIKKETSVGCSVSKRLCSICGQEHRPGGCGHIPGKEYDGKLCYLELSEATDAYEWSFVAVPAQKGAGVVKRFGLAGGLLKDFIRSDAGMGYAAEYEALEKDAVMGREHTDALKNEILRLGLISDRKLFEALEGSVKFMGAAELLSLKEVLEGRVKTMFPLRTQLPGRDEVTSFDDLDYMV